MQTDLMSERPETHVWPILTFTDALKMADFMEEAFGFERGVVITSEADPRVVIHGEMWWPLGGGVMFGTVGKDDSPFSTRAPGNDAIYLVTHDPDGLYERSKAAGAEVFYELEDATYGSRTFSVFDPEGNRWSFGTYTGE